MKFELNGDAYDLECEFTVQTLLQHLDLERRRVAVALNSQVVPRSLFDRTRIAEGDRIEVIQAVGGG